MSEEIPFDRDDADIDYRISAGIADGKTTEQVIKENTFPPVPRGKNAFYVKKVSLSKDEQGQTIEKVFNVFMPDSETGHCTIETPYQSMEAEVTFALIDDDRVTIRDRFRLPPLDEDENNAYMYGSSKAGSDRPGNGLWFNKLRIMLHSLGHEDGENGQLSQEATSLRNWKFWPDNTYRTIVLNVVDQNDYKGDGKSHLGKDGNPYPTISLNGYERTDETLVRLGLLGPNTKSPSPSPSPAPQPVATKPTTKPATPQPAATRPPQRPAAPTPSATHKPQMAPVATGPKPPTPPRRSI